MKLKSFLSKSEDYARNLICGLMLLIMGFLFLESFTHTMRLSSDEKIFEGITYHYDNVIFNIVYMLAALLILSVILPKLEKLPDWLIKLFPVLSTVILGTIWVNSVQSAPVADQSSVMIAAKYAAQDDFFFMSQRYISNCPYQLGMILFYEIIIRLIGSGYETYEYIQIINVIHLALAYLGLLGITEHLFNSKRTLTIASLIMIFSVQPIIYTSFIYGVIPGITYTIYAFLAEILFFESKKKSRIIYGIISALFMSLAIMVKTNNYIALVALAGMAFVKLIKKPKADCAAFLVIMVLCSVNVLSAVTSFYEKRSGETLNESVPMIAYMAMGLDDPEGKYGCDAPGWYSSEHTSSAHRANGYDSKKTSAEAKEVIGQRIHKFINNYSYATDFFGEKITSQWNEPTYACLWVNIVMHNYEGKTHGKIAGYICGSGYAETLDYMNVIQLFVYMSSFAGVIVCFRKKDILCCGLILIVLGAFMYHLIFEGKSQYILPYYILLTGFSAVGTEYLVNLLNKVLSRRASSEKVSAHS